MHHVITFLILCTLALSSCSLPDVNLATKEPIKVDVNVNLNVYQVSKPGEAEKKLPTDEAESTIINRRKQRSGEVQILKNSRLVVENHRGLLTLRETPAGQEGDWAKKVVEEENRDRTALMINQAKKESKQLQEIEKREWKLNQERAFAGEWIEVSGAKEGMYEWQQKK